jgi:hypothetical protein
MQKYGIKETDEALTTLLGLIDAGISAGEKGGGFINNLPLFVPPLVTLPAAIEGGDKIPKEITDVDEDEGRFLLNKHGERIADEDYKELIFYFLNTVRKAKDVINKEKDSAHR